MAFMQKAMDKRRKRAKEEASVLLRELEEASAAAHDEEEDSADETRNRSASRVRGGERGEKQAAARGGGSGKNSGGASTRASKAAAADVARDLPAGTLQSSAVSMDARVRSSVASPITVDLGGREGGNSSMAPLSSMGIGMGDGDSVGNKAQSLNRPEDDAKAESMEAESARSKRVREAKVAAAKAATDGRDVVGKPGAKFGDEGGAAMSEEAEEDTNGDNPWLAPTPRRSKERRRASNGEVLLDVGKAAATALSALTGGSDGTKESHDNGKSVGRRDMEGDATGETPASRSTGAESSDATGGKRQGGEGQGGGRKRKRKRGGGKSNGGNGGCAMESQAEAAEANEGGNEAKKANGGGTEAKKMERENRSKSDSEVAGKGPPTGAKDGGSGAAKAGRQKQTETGEANGGEGNETKKSKRANRGKNNSAVAGKGPPTGAKDRGGGGAAKAAKKKQTDTAVANGGGIGAKKSKGGKGGRSNIEGAGKGSLTGAKDGHGGGGAAKEGLAGLSNEQLVRRAFAAPDFETEFKASKDDEVEAAVSKGREKLPKDVAGWGSWAGEGAPVTQRPSKRQVAAQQVQVCLWRR